MVKDVLNFLILSFFIINFFEKLRGQENMEMIFPDEKKVVLSNNLDIAYFNEGMGEKNILFIHGLGSNKKAWLNIIPKLSENYTLYALDLPKFLDTEDVSNVGMKKYAECVRMFMEELKIEKAVICGHSMGGQIAVHFALSNLELTEKLILLAPAGLEEFNEEEVKWFDTYVTKAFFLSQTDEQIKRNFDINFYGNAIPQSAAFMLSDRLELKKDTISYERYADYIVACVQSMLKEPIIDLLPELKSQTLVVFGENDLLIPNTILHPALQVEDVLDNANYIPHVKTSLFDQTGHFIQWDRPKLLSEIITQFIQVN